MSDYTKTTDFAAKDALAPGNAAKVITGTGHNTEYNNIATAVATKADKASPTFTGTVTTAAISATTIAGSTGTFSGLVYGRGGGQGLGRITVSASAASGMSAGDIWFQY